ncbi:LCP family protein [Pseudonocardia xishanensis]|uniref:LytR family transcriptional attenuator n=1 Tax=Pseudonocardia xishanensis TaxID=630995 RepID=A0ABP8RNH9_9PSEU
MQDEADRTPGRRSRAARRARQGDAPAADDVLARLGIRAPAEGSSAPWLEEVPVEDPATTELPRVEGPRGEREVRPPDPRVARPAVPPVARPATPPPTAARPSAPAAPGSRPATGIPTPPTRERPPRGSRPAAGDPGPRGTSAPPERDRRDARRSEAGPGTAEDAGQERAESLAERTRRIDASLTRLTAAHTEPDEVPDTQDDLDDPADEPRRRADRRVTDSRPSRLSTAGRIGAAVLAALVFLGIAGSWSATRWMDSTIRTVSALDPTTGVVGAETQTGDENLLLLGTASGTSGAQASRAGRADTLMLTHVPADGGRAVAVSLPLGLEINRPPCERWDPAAAAYLDETVSAETRTPLATAYRVGGPRCLVRTVQQLSGIAVTRFVALDLPGVGGMVDALGGVDTCLERPVRAGEDLVPAGTARLDGARAALVAQTAGPDQVARQQRLLAATFRGALSTSTLLSPTATRDFAAALGRSMLADDASVEDLLRLTSALGTETASLVPLPVGSVPNTRGNLDLRGTEASALFAAIREHEPLPELSTPVATESGPEPGDVTVNVLNAADRTGLAGEVGGSLRTLGFGVGEVGNAAEPTADTVLRFSPDRADAAALLGRVVPAARLVQDPAGQATLQLVLGTSFDGVVRAPVATAPDDADGGGSVVHCG